MKKEKIANGKRTLQIKKNKIKYNENGIKCMECPFSDGPMRGIFMLLIQNVTVFIISTNAAHWSMCLSGKVYRRRVINSAVLIGKSHVNSVKKELGMINSK